jgi:hypothetical protein
LIASLVNLPPDISAEDLRSKLNAAISSNMDWSNGDDESLYETFGEIRKNLNKKRKVKKGVNALPQEIQSPLISLLDTLKGYGLFLVPVVELENWLGDQNIEVSKAKKTLWANGAASQIRQIRL